MRIMRKRTRLTRKKIRGSILILVLLKTLPREKTSTTNKKGMLLKRGIVCNKTVEMSRHRE